MKRIGLIALLLSVYVGLNAETIKELAPTFGQTAKFEEWDKVLILMDKDYATLSKKDQNLVANYEMQGPYQTVSDGCSWYCSGGPSEKKASSYLAGTSTLKYTPNLIHDFDLRTAWVEGKSDNGIGESVMFYFAPNSPRVDTICIFNGYQKSQKAWNDNARVKTFKLYINGKLYAILHLEDTTTEQIFKIEPVRSTKEGVPLELKLEIGDVYAGAKYTDTAISEINFDGLDVHCFDANTQVTMADGSTKAISEVAISDTVLSYNETTGEFENAEVLETDIVRHGNIIQIHFADGSSIISTDSHPYLTTEGWAANNVKGASKYDIVLSKKLIKGDMVRGQATDKTIDKIVKLSGIRLTYAIVKLSKNAAYIANGVIVNAEEME